ncbi:MAG: hypothetical protein KAI29_29805, partial [Cyclobacteriaceae bacterium]|nr:hypothetical protein [Cyclobacteriaceae bacterium]
MHRLSPIIFLLGLTINLVAQNPHGEDFQMDCAACHTSKGWEIQADFWKNNKPIEPLVSETTGMELPYKSRGFDHNSTDFVLQGQHALVDCRGCHQTLVFSEANTECVSCHTDMHNQTVGADCARCHNTEIWLVDNITELHQDNGFPLLGAHFTAYCSDCHDSESALTFERIGNECINCHMDEYTATNSPNHIGAGFSINCIECHDINGFDWSTENINHDFFPLTKGHDTENCAKCHNSADYSNTPTDCFECHQADYNASVNPNHVIANFSIDCKECHTT